ncbi:MAG: hydrogenase nickel incorporation protein HypA [Euryarchaeota archaeon]|nr:hydrogenase nickel incorporation protein HypA [Euryarchaeota archaeon]
MHEWALAEAVISTAMKTVKEKNINEVTEFRIKMGELQQIELEIFEFAMKQMMKKYQVLKNAKIDIEMVEALLRCNSCGHEWGFAKDELTHEESESIHFIPEMAHTYLRCPECGSPDFEVIRGRGVELESLEVK